MGRKTKKRPGLMAGAGNVEELMLYELSKEEIEHIERYRDLTEEFQAALDSQMKVLFDLQTNIFKEMIQAK